ncbi:LPS-assembly protein LptD [Myroides marinus]|uniref:putative LPS assembly protein LptD n=1 Tax=Myroides marinus TaxID=703342 RepID=UPI0025754B13|nr:putative LPS assembly protein LptD [Myroides marinus]MDM1362370.1 LPS-assembly protein LptD [Myroides marinus]MDM1363937.1 LPS-assembly protein LptD [Myroides marinus]MDM1369077.1 LPS-assembly protein LptD [Myroides marinus]MDM1372372.1 LPS-assembly protein LptD [Myroides marinus]MDM1375494.1 LPS-assembly protein LptD [Myroides marinus]
MRTNIFNIVFILSVFGATLTQKSTAQDYNKKFTTVNTTIKKDSIVTPKDTIERSTVPVKDTLKSPKKVQDTLAPKTKPLLEGLVFRKAKDYEALNLAKKEITLYNEAEIRYQDYELTAGKIIFNYEKNEIYAGGIKDSVGNMSQYPVFKQGSQVVEPDSIRFNTKTKKAIVFKSRTSQGEFRIKAGISKKENDSVYFMKDVIFTTAKDLDDPEYYFRTNKVKLVPGKKVVTGVTNMVIADVPTPLGLPFAFFPMSEKAESGFIIPSFGDTNQQGYYIQNGGYYFAISDKMDLNVLGDYYTNGSWGLRLNSSYAQRYKYNGRVLIRYENNIFSEKGLPDYASSKLYNIQWNHSQDGKANPNSRFSASVNLGSSQYFRQSNNSYNVGSSLNNTMSSSISYQRTFESVPQVNMSLTATHSQSTNTKEINMTLPTLQVNVDRVFPFAPKYGSKKGIIKNLNFSYSVRGENRVKTHEDYFFKREMFDSLNTAFQHSIPIATNFKIFKYFSVTAGASYNEVWYFNTIKKEYNAQTNKVDDIRVNGFDSFRTYSANASIGTTVYGTFNFGEDKKLQAIRHVMRPSVGYSYTPSFEQYYDTYAIDATGQTMQDYTRFQNGIFGAPGRYNSNMMSFNLSNTFEAKVRDDENEKGEPKKVMLLNSLNFSTSYNMSADSLKWAPMRISTGTALFKDKMQINLGATLDPYALDNNNRRIDTYNINNGGSLFRLTSANLTVNWSMSSKDAMFGGSDDKKNQNSVDNGGRNDDLFGRAVELGNQKKSTLGDEDEDKPFGGFFNAKLPWDLTFAYSMTYNNSSRQNEIVNNSVMVSGNIDVTPNWKVGFSTGYDFVQKGVTFTQLRFERDLKSWRMDFSWVPIGTYTSWGFFIGIRSSMLSDIKWEKRKAPDKIYR